MGHELMKRALAEVHRVPEAAFGLLMLLAHDAHDADPHPCCWTSLKVLIEKLEGDASPAAVKRFRRRMTMLEDAGLVTRDCEAHDRPTSRQCPKDHRWFHVELLPPIGDAQRPVSDAEIGTPGVRYLPAIGDAQRPK
jgi:hypothetical protein